ncbi:hypothetical protein M413DRAFT_196603 [Hebeloma cylindrosporum]|uniref:Uncharacterized protein n=1 Tax=Hebeloma cylindrosporum TaxID=76867 RepID=A0A0C2YE26_HEBCY|nr:hypothetical protein M413DRAFT_196603 [Hebeloma cylindrosporum h7]
MTKHSIMILLDLLDPRSWSKVKLEVYNIFQEHPGTRKCVRNVLELGNRREHQSAPFPFTFQSYTWLSYPTIRSPSFASNREAYNEKSEAAKVTDKGVKDPFDAIADMQDRVILLSLQL